MMYNNDQIISEVKGSKSPTQKMKKISAHNEISDSVPSSLILLFLVWCKSYLNQYVLSQTEKKIK